jgi:hypothetical protein
VSGVALYRRTKILAAVAIILLFAIGSGGLRGDVDHTFLTSLVDQSGIFSVQYMESGSIRMRCCAISGTVARRKMILDLGVLIP